MISLKMILFILLTGTSTFSKVLNSLKNLIQVDGG